MVIVTSIKCNYIAGLNLRGRTIEKLSKRKGELVSVDNAGTNTVRIEFEMPTRGIIGYRSEFLTDTRGLGIMASRFTGYGSWKGEIISRSKGSVISIETGVATAYAIEGFQERTVIFVEPTEKIYKGQIVGENSRNMDMTCNPTKKKQLTNHRASSKDMTVKIDVPRKMTLEQAMEWIRDDELVEVTPKTIRLRKTILDYDDRKRASKKDPGAMKLI